MIKSMQTAGQTKMNTNRPLVSIFWSNVLNSLIDHFGQQMIANSNDQRNTFNQISFETLKESLLINLPVNRFILNPLKNIRKNKRMIELKPLIFMLFVIFILNFFQPFKLNRIGTNVLIKPHAKKL
jgi:hypothetical protein